LQGYSTLGSQWLKAGHVQNPVLDNALVQAIAQEVERDAAQVVLKWALQHGQVCVSNIMHCRLLWAAHDNARTSSLQSVHCLKIYVTILAMTRDIARNADQDVDLSACLDESHVSEVMSVLSNDTIIEYCNHMSVPICLSDIVLGLPWAMRAFPLWYVHEHAAVWSFLPKCPTLHMKTLHLQAVVPRSSKQERIAANRVLDFELSDKQMRRIDALDGIVTPEAV